MDTRECAQCGALFAPRREHARFCSARCRVAWNRQIANSPGAGEGVLGWSLSATRETTGRLLRTTGFNRPQAYTVITEAVWWCTMVDATLVRYYPDTYSATLATRDDEKRQVIEDTFAGLRFVRNHMGYNADPEDFILPLARQSSPADGRIAAWTWKSVRQPSLSALPQRGQDWEMTRYRAYQDQLAGRPIGDAFSQAADFLRQASDASLSHA